MNTTAAPAVPKTEPAATVAIESLANSPAVFIENQGQWADETIRFALSRRGVNVGVTDDGLRFQLFQASAPTRESNPAAHGRPPHPPFGHPLHHWGRGPG